MAQKMTKKERREAAKRARLEAQKQAARRRVMKRIYGGAVLAVAIALIVFLVTRSQQSNQQAVEELNALAAAASCGSLESPPLEGNEHVQTPVQYQTDPPTSGDHNGRWWERGGAQTGDVPTVIQNEQLVHNLEHGAVVLRYKPDVSDDVKAALDAVANADPQWVISVTDTTMTPAVAFTSWGKLMACDGSGSPDDISAAAQGFIDGNKRKGPEDIPL